MASLRQRSRRFWLAIGLALGLAIMPVSMTFTAELIDFQPGVTVVSADECENVTCG